jgi:sec-independent protein translocase protein TatA
MMAEVFGADGIIVLIVVLALLFGGAAIPKLARSLGSAKNDFEKGMEEGKKAVSLGNMELSTKHGVANSSDSRPPYPGVRLVSEPDFTQPVDGSNI